MSLLIRRGYLFCTWLSLSLVTTTAVVGEDPPLIKTTHVYKTVGDVKVEADVSRPEGAEARPVLVWILTWCQPTDGLPYESV